MHRASTRKRTNHRRPLTAPAAGAALLGALALAACGGRTDGSQGRDDDPMATSGGTAAGTGSSVTVGPTPTTGSTPEPDATVSPPIGVFPTNAPGDATLVPRPGATVTPKPFVPVPVTRTPTTAQKLASINASYDAFTRNLSGLFETFSPTWQNALAQVATPDMTLAATRAAVSIQRSKSHTVGTLRDKHRKINIKGNEAELTSCLDERNWYAVKDETGEPDIGIRRGYFIGRATFIYTSGRWYVNTWNSLPTGCNFNAPS